MCNFCVSVVRAISLEKYRAKFFKIKKIIYFFFYCTCTHCFTCFCKPVFLQEILSYFFRMNRIVEGSLKCSFGKMAFRHTNPGSDLPKVLMCHGWQDHLDVFKKGFKFDLKGSKNQPLLGRCRSTLKTLSSLLSIILVMVNLSMSPGPGTMAIQSS